MLLNNTKILYERSKQSQEAQNTSAHDGSNSVAPVKFNVRFVNSIAAKNTCIIPKHKTQHERS